MARARVAMHARDADDPHEAPLYLFRARPELVPDLLRDALHVAVPAHSEVRIEESDFVQLVPTEYRADLVLDAL